MEFETKIKEEKKRKGIEIDFKWKLHPTSREIFKT